MFAQGDGQKSEPAFLSEQALHQKCPCPQFCATEVHSQLDAMGIPPLKNGKNIYKSFDLYKINYCAVKSISATNASAAATSARPPSLEVRVIINTLLLICARYA